MVRFRFIFLVLAIVLTPTIILAQAQPFQSKESIYAIVKDIQGDQLEGYLLLYPNEITVSTKDDQEKSIPLKIIESIKVEKIKGGIPGADQLNGESYYSVQVRNSQEIFTLKKRYTFSLNTGVGVVTRTIDPEMVQGAFRKDSSSTTRSQSEEPFIHDKNAVLSLEIKF